MAVEQRPRIGCHLLPLALIAQHLLYRHKVRLPDGVQTPLLPDKGPIPGELAAAVDAVKFRQLLQRGDLSLLPGRKRRGDALPQLVPGQLHNTVQHLQIVGGGSGEGRRLLPFCHCHGEGGLVIAEVVGEIGGQGVVTLPGKGEIGISVGSRPCLLLGVQTVQRLYGRQTQQITVDGQSVEIDLEFHLSLSLCETGA